MCEGAVEGHLEARIQHLEQHLLRPGPEWFTTDLEVLAAYVRAQHYRICLVCPIKIVAGSLKPHLALGHSIVLCPDCPTSEDGMEGHVQSAHPTSRCDECRQHHQQDRLSIHLRQDHSYERCPRCPRIVPPDSLDKHIEQHGKWRCEKQGCTKLHDTLGALQRHISRNHREDNQEEQTCPDCGASVKG